MNGYDEAQHPRGRAGNAGQFREKTNSTPTDALAAAGVDVAGELVATVTTVWVEHNVIPPRARKPRDIDRRIEVTVSIPAISADAAPVAFEVPTDTWLRQPDGEIGLTPIGLKLRVYDGQLYRQITTPERGEMPRGLPATPETLADKALYRTGDGVALLPGIEPSSPEEAQARVQEEVDSYLSIDGKLWQRTGEPIYRISTYGLGHNHGGTSLHVDVLMAEERTNEHATPDYVFPADQHEQAIEAAMKVAIERGDDQSVTGIRSTPRIEATGQFDVASTYRPAPRIEYTLPYAADNAEKWEGDTGALRREFDRFKAQLMTVPGAVVEVDDGWGGTTKTIDRRVLTEHQARDYDRYVELTATIGR